MCIYSMMTYLISFFIVLFQAPAPITRRTRVHPTTSTRRLHMLVTVTTLQAPAVFLVGISREFWSTRVRRSRPCAMYYYTKFLY